MNKDIEIDLKQLFNNYLNKIWVVITAAIVAGVAVIFLLSKINAHQTYQATALIRIAENIEEKEEDTYESVLARKTEIIDSVQEIAKMRETIEPVIEKLDLDRSYNEMAKNIILTRNGSTDILQVEASSDSEALAPQIVNAVADSIEETATLVLGEDYLDVIERAEEPEDKNAEKPSFFNMRNIKKMIIVSVAMFVLFSGMYLVISIYIPRFNNKYDVEAILELPVIIEATSKNSKQEMDEIARQLMTVLNENHQLKSVALINYATNDWNAIEKYFNETNLERKTDTAVHLISGSTKLSTQMIEYTKRDATIIILDRTKTNPYSTQTNIDTMKQLGDKFYGVILV